jgi:hypothetical protein
MSVPANKTVTEIKNTYKYFIVSSPESIFTVRLVNLDFTTSVRII